jgi:hypothetical protein
MPILHVGEATAVVFLKRSMRPGFSGIENELLYAPGTTLLFGDAKDSLTKVLQSLKTSERCAGEQAHSSVTRARVLVEAGRRPCPPGGSR